MRRALPSALSLCVVLAVLAGCGDGERDRISRLLSDGFTSQDPRVVCEGSLSPALLSRIYGSTAKCHELESEPGERFSQAQSVDESIDASMRRCVTLKMSELGDAAFRRLAFGADAAARRRLSATARRCQAIIAAAERTAV